MSKLIKNENGIGQVLVIAIIVVVLVVAGLIIWQATKTKKSPTSNIAPTSASTTKTTSKPLVSSACQKVFNDSSLCAFAAHSNISTMAYNATGTSTSATGSKSTFTVVNDGKGNTEVTYSNGGQLLTSVTLDGNTYVQTGAGGTWYEYSGSSLGSAQSVPNPTSGFNLNFTTSIPAGVSVSKVGTSACGNLTCNQYKVTDSSTPTTTEYVYFDTTNYLLREWTSNDTSTGVSVDLTFSYPSAPITIKMPSPVQQISS